MLGSSGQNCKKSSLKAKRTPCPTRGEVWVGKALSHMFHISMEGCPVICQRHPQPLPGVLEISAYILLVTCLRVKQY